MEAKRISDHRSYKMSDSDIVKRVLSGEKELFEILLRRHNQTLYRVIRSYLGNEYEIEDVMQDVWLKTWKNLHQFRHKASFSTWLLRIGINQALSLIRETQNKTHHAMERDVNSDKIAVLKSSSRMNPENKTIRYETRRLLEQAIDRLPAKYRSVYMLREVEEMSTVETAECLQISESNVKVRLHRARLLLKDYLMDMLDNEDLFEFGNSRCDDLVDIVMKRIL